MKTNKNGFAPIAAILLAAVVILVIGGGVYYADNKKNNNVVEQLEVVPPTTQATSTAQISNNKEIKPSQRLIVDLKTVKVGDTFGNLTVGNSSVSLYPDGSPKSVRMGFIGNMIVTGTVGMNDMTGALVLSATKESGAQIPNLKGEDDVNGGFCLTGDTSEIGVPLGVSREVTVEVKNYSIYLEGKGGCGTRAELVRIISASSLNTQAGDWNTYKNTARKFEIKYPKDFLAREIYTKNVIVCFDNQSKPFAVCVEDESNSSQVVNNADLFRELRLDVAEKRLNAPIKIELSGGLYNIHVNNLVIHSSDKVLLQEMIPTLQLFGYNQGISK